LPGCVSFGCTNWRCGGLALLLPPPGPIDAERPPLRSPTAGGTALCPCPCPPYPATLCGRVTEYAFAFAFEFDDEDDNDDDEAPWPGNGYSYGSADSMGVLFSSPGEWKCWPSEPVLSGVDPVEDMAGWLCYRRLGP